MARCAIDCIYKQDRDGTEQLTLSRMKSRSALFTVIRSLALGSASLFGGGMMGGILYSGCKVAGRGDGASGGLGRISGRGPEGREGRKWGTLGEGNCQAFALDTRRSSLYPSITTLNK